MYPYYGLLEGVDEEDPNYLLKLLRIKPDRGYIPTFLNAQGKEEDESSVFEFDYEAAA